MSGGVDSAVAAARAVDAGHDVTGVHLALARNPQTYRSGARGCCTVEDARDARRAADVLGIPFYVWDMADQFHASVVDDFVAEYAAGRTPNPCLRCNEKIKFAAVLDRAVALGFDAVVTGHHARLGSDGLLRRSVDLAKDQSYVLAVLTRAQLDRSVFPLGCSTKTEVRAAAAARGLAVAGQAGLARHLLHRRRRYAEVPAGAAGLAAGLHCGRRHG
jgi:tRNA-specific 2-thiouridylase